MSDSVPMNVPPAEGCCGSSGAAAPATASQVPGSKEALRQAVQDRYAAAARQALTGGQAGCGSPDNCADGAEVCDPGALYSEQDVASVPAGAAAVTLGCGNPTALADLRAGEVVLDLGSGGGLDVLLSAHRVGPTGFAYGLDMTPEMLALAERHRQESGLENVRFLKGQMEAIPLPDASVDVVISNCVINLSVDKPAVFREAFRVLRPGGRFAVSDIVLQRPLPAATRHDLEAWAGCVAGALPEQDYRDGLTTVGFEDVSVEVIREMADGMVSAFIRGRKPAARAPAEVPAE